jgi:FeS assembly SUF system protein
VTDAALASDAVIEIEGQPSTVARPALIDAVIAALRTVHDPEIPLNVYDLGLIYRIGKKGSDIGIDMTLTAPGCPVASEIVRSVEEAVKAAPGVGAVDVVLVFDPPWDQSKMTDEAKLHLGLI